MLDVEVLGPAPSVPPAPEIERLVAIALASAGVEDGHVAVEFVDEDDEPVGPRELGDIVICAPETADLREAVVHGALHLVGMDHETDDGELLALQRELLAWDRS